MMSQALPAPSRSMTGSRVAFLAVSFALPSWLISILFHAGLLGGLATLTWTVTRKAPNQEFTVGIMLKKDTPQGQAFESQDTTYVTHEESVNHPPQFLPDAEPSFVAQALPRMPEADLSAIGLAGSMLKGMGEMLAVPDGGVGGAMANTQFLGVQVWGSKFVFVIDRSGSMSQRDRLGHAKRELLSSLAKLPPETQFQIIFYNLRPEMMPMGGAAKRLLFATDANKNLAGRFIDSIVADGGTEHLPALKMALSIGPDVIFFLTDADDLRARDVKEATDLNQDRARIHTIEFGLGPEIGHENTLRDLADGNGGTYRYIDTAKLGSGEEKKR